MFLLTTFMEYFILFWTFILICYKTASGRIIYIDEERTFSEAQRYCKSRNGSLINPRHLNQTRYCVPEYENFWIGEIITLSAWMSLIGCFGDNSLSKAKQYNLNDADPAVCEVMCREHAVFGLSRRQCVCMNNTVMGKDVSANNCNDDCDEKFPIGSCGGNTYYTVYKRDSFVYQKSNTLMDSVLKCASASCISNSLLKTEDDCKNDYKTICRHSGRNGIDPFFNPWKKASELCFQQNAYLVNPVSIDCGQVKETAQTWLSLFRNFASLYINDVKDHTIGDIETCTSVSFDGFKFSKIMDNKCNERYLPFLCEISSLRDNDIICDSLPTASDTTFQPTTTGTSENGNQTTAINSHNNSVDSITSGITLTSRLYGNVTRVLTGEYLPIENKMTGVIIGAVVAIVVIIAVCIVVAVVICRYRKAQIKQNDRREAHSANFMQREEGENNGFAKDFSNPVPKEKINVSKHDSGYELASIPNHEEKSHSLWKERNKIIENMNNDTGYEFASIPKQVESDYVYSDTVEGDYDLLNRKDDRKIKNTDREDTNVYSRTGGFEGTYDTTNSLSHKDDISDTYDHANISNMVAPNNDDNDPYDHTNMC